MAPVNNNSRLPLLTVSSIAHPSRQRWASRRHLRRPLRQVNNHRVSLHRSPPLDLLQTLFSNSRASSNNLGRPLLYSISLKVNNRIQAFVHRIISPSDKWALCSSSSKDNPNPNKFRVSHLKILCRTTSWPFRRLKLWRSLRPSSTRRHSACLWTTSGATSPLKTSQTKELRTWLSKLTRIWRSRTSSSIPCRASWSQSTRRRPISRYRWTPQSLRCRSTTREPIGLDSFSEHLKWTSETSWATEPSLSS